MMLPLFFSIPGAAKNKVHSKILGNISLYEKNQEGRWTMSNSPPNSSFSKKESDNRILKQRSYIPPSVFTYQYNKRNYNKSYDEYLMKFIQDNTQSPNSQDNIFPFIQKQLSDDINGDNDKLVDILLLYLHIYEYNHKYKKGTPRSKEMMYDESALLALQLLLDDIIDIDVEDMIEEFLEEEEDQQ